MCFATPEVISEETFSAADFGLLAEDSQGSDALTDARIVLVAERVHTRLTQAEAKKARDDVVRAKLRKNSITGEFARSPRDVADDLHSLLDLVSTLEASDMDTAGSAFVEGKETSKILAMRDFLADLEHKYFDVSTRRNFRERLLETDSKGNVYSTLAVWSGFEAMDAALADPDSLCNFRVPVINLMFIIWEELFCDASAATPSILSDLSPEALTSVTKAVMRFADDHLHPESPGSVDSAATYRALRRLFGDYLTEDNIRVAGLMGTVVSRIFVSTFSRRQEDGGRVIIYFSDNKQDYKKDPSAPSAPLLDISSIASESEIPVIMRSLSNEVFEWRWVAWNKWKKVGPSNIQFVRSRDNPNILHNRQRVFTVGMPGESEWKLFTHQPPRPRVALSPELTPLFV